MTAKILRFFALFLTSLLVGAMFGIWLVDPADLTATTYVEQQQSMIRALNTRLPALGGLCIALNATLSILTKDSWNRILLIAAVVCLVCAGLITRFANQPINSQVMTWNTQAPPPNWQVLRDTWWHWHIARTSAGLGALGVALVATLRNAKPV